MATPQAIKRQARAVVGSAANGGRRAMPSTRAIRRQMRKLQAMGLEGALRASGWDGPAPPDEEYGWFLVSLCRGWVVPR
jgi:hypothetical protein